MKCVVYSGHISAPFDVISGIPQDTVLYQVPYCSCNNIISMIYQHVSLLPAVCLEMTVCYRKTESAEDCRALQCNLCIDEPMQVS